MVQLRAGAYSGIRTVARKTVKYCRPIKTDPRALPAPQSPGDNIVQAGYMQGSVLWPIVRGNDVDPVQQWYVQLLSAVHCLACACRKMNPAKRDERRQLVNGRFISHLNLGHASSCLRDLICRLSSEMTKVFVNCPPAITVMTNKNKKTIAESVQHKQITMHF
jgi:hypothetical protein